MTLRRLMIAVAMLLFGVAAYLAIQPFAVFDPASGGPLAPTQANGPPAESSLAKGAGKAAAVPASGARANSVPAESGPVHVGLRSKPTIRLGEPLAVTIEAPIRRTLGSIGLTLSYDPRRLNLMSVVKGDLLGGTRGDKPSVEEPNDGVAIIHASVRGASQKIGPGNLLVMNFETLQRGITEVKVSDVDLSAPDATLLGRQREARSTIIVE
jgi:hypothetical protein